VGLIQRGVSFMLANRKQRAVVYPIVAKFLGMIATSGFLVSLVACGTEFNSQNRDSEIG
jgi:hypothetical protein